MNSIHRLKLFVVAAIFAVGLSAMGQSKPDWVTGFPRELLLPKEWKPGKKVAVCFVLYVEVWGFGQGPDFRPDMVTRNPDLVNGSFREYAIHHGVNRVGQLFQEQDAPLSIALNALFPQQQPEVWKSLRAAVPNAPIVAHGMNNSNDLLPMGQGIAEQKKYIKRTLDLIEKETGVRPKGWTSPSVYFNADTFRACAAEGLSYTLDSMDSDYLSVLSTPDGRLLLIPYPAVTVDMGQFLSRYKQPEDMERLWIDYIGELAREAEKKPDGDATVVAIGIHPFVVGTPHGAASMRRVLEALKKMDTVWVTDVETVMQKSKFN